MLPALRQSAQFSASRHAGLGGITQTFQGPIAFLSTNSNKTVAAAVPVEVDESYKEKLPHIPLDFNDAKAAFKSKSQLDILRTWAVLSTCQTQPLVKNADSLLAWSQKVFGSHLVNFGIKHTFFGHFCAGETQKALQPSLKLLKTHGIGAILDYAAEDDVQAEDGPASRSELNDSVVARTFDYDNEAKCEQHTGTFLRNIKAASEAPGQGFAAIKVTALGNPKLLERVSNGVLTLQALFKQFDTDNNNVVTRDEFNQVYESLFTDATPERIDELFDQLDESHTGYIDYLEWSKRVDLKDVPKMVKNCRTRGPLFQSSLTEDEFRQLRRMMRRLHDLADAASKLNVKLMVDAEHSYFQPAIDHAVAELQQIHNKKEAVIFNTYQCYLKDAEARLAMDMDRAQREGFHFGAKLVRGAYMYLERAVAEKKNIVSPIWDTIEQTHLCYNRAVKAVLNRVRSEGAEVMIASHNQYSVETAVAEMYELDIDPRSQPVFFGQLLGMADPLSFVLGNSGYRAYKYVPWGPVQEVMPYLIRRAQENSTVMGGVQNEKNMLLREFWRRLKEDTFPMSLFKGRGRGDKAATA